MSANLYPNEIIKLGELLKREQVTWDTVINVFRPGPMVAVAEWLVDDPSTPTGKKWVRFDIATGREITGQQLSLNPREKANG